MGSDWRNQTDAVFKCERSPARGSRGLVVGNHPLASSAGAEMLAAGGNAIALVEIDGTVSPDLLAKVQQIPNVQQVKPLQF